MASKKENNKRLLATSSVSSFQSLKEKNNSLVDVDDRDLEDQPKLRLFESPLAHDRIASTTEKPRVTISGPNGISRTASTENLTLPNRYNDRSNDVQEYPGTGRPDADIYETPEFRRYEESTNIELFYDLFFVANLTTFTDVLEITDTEALKSYAGFFCILWFLWVQVSLFDVRFVTDSILERLFKAAQFGVMVGLAAVGPNFNPENQKQHTFQSLAIILMLSRAVLAMQYAGVLYHVWNYKTSKAPLAMVTGASIVAALIYMGTFFGFKKNDTKSKVFVVWYVTAVIETAVNIAISASYKVLSFSGSHLVQRMSLLTLIILGEGVIGVCKSIATVVEVETSFPGGLIGTVAAAVVILYFIYMIYFDWVNHAKFGAFRQELWAFLHFPFHLALVFLVEGAARFIVWRKVLEIVSGINKDFDAALRKFTASGTDSIGLSGVIVSVIDTIYKRFPPKFTQTLVDTQEAIYKVGNATFNSTEQREGLLTLYSTIQDSIFDTFDIEPPEAKSFEVENPNDEWARHVEAFVLVFTYFFIASGITLILMNVLNVISRPKLLKGDYIRIGVFFSIGIVLALLATTVTTETGFDFAQSAWVLPTVALAFVFVMGFGYTKLL